MLHNATADSEQFVIVLAIVETIQNTFSFFLTTIKLIYPALPDHLVSHCLLATLNQATFAKVARPPEN